MSKKNLLSRWWAGLTLGCGRASASSRSASTGVARAIGRLALLIVPAKINGGRVRLGAIVFLSALGFALFGIIMRAALMAAPVDVAPTWGTVLFAGGAGNSGVLSSTELYDPGTNSFAAAADTAAMNTARWGATAALLASGKVLIAGGEDIFD